MLYAILNRWAARRIVFPAALLAVLLAASPSLAVTPYLVEDIDPVPFPADSSPHDFSEVFFLADDGEHGTALWKSDGTEAGTVPVDPVDWTGRTAERFTLFKGRLYYFLDGALWRTDGTRAGTVRVADLNAFFHDSNPPLLTEAGGRLYFFAGESGKLRLWSTDGTPAGTRRVTTFGLEADDDFFPNALAAAGGRIFISGSTYPDGGSLPVSGLWVSDGTEAGTRFLGEISMGRDRFGQGAVEHQGRLAFVGPGGLWLSDGTAAGTAPLLDAEGHEIREPRNLRSFGGRLVFAAADGQGFVALWESDGTPAGTRQVLRLGPTSSGYGEDLVVAGSRLFFLAYDPTVGGELWALRPD